MSTPSRIRQTPLWRISDQVTVKRRSSSISFLLGSFTVLSHSVFVSSWQFQAVNCHLSPHRFSRQYHSRADSTSNEQPAPSIYQLSNSSLQESIKAAYDVQETDGILQLAQSDKQILLNTRPDELIQASIAATQGCPRSRAAAAGVINAWIGACCLLGEAKVASGEKGAEIAESLWMALQEQTLEDQSYITPDIVTYCLTYHAVHLFKPSLARSILEEGLKSSKRKSGSKRRKALAAARRRGSTNRSVDTKQLEKSLQEVLEDDSLRVLRETDDYIVISKPSGVTCYHTSTTTAGKISNNRNKSTNGSSNESENTKQRDISMEDALLHCHVSLSTLNPDCQGLVHRLDRCTSGCMIWSKTDEMHANLVAAFFLRQVKKRYTALVSPAPIKLEPDNPIIKIDSKVQGHVAQSRVTLLESYGDVAAAVLVEPLTGRRHQVRVHCSDGLNSPVVLDPIYGRQDTATIVLSFIPKNLAQQVLNNDFSSGEENSKKKKIRRKQAVTVQTAPQDQRFFLHSSSLSIPSIDISVEAPLPLWWNETIEQLKAIAN